MTALPRSATIGPVGITFATASPGNGGNTVVWLADQGNGTLYALPDRPTLLPSTPSVAAAPYPAAGIAGLATVQLPDGLGPHFYMAEQSTGQVIEFAPGSGALLGVVSSIPDATALVPYPEAAPSPCAAGDGGIAAGHCHHLFVSGGTAGNSVYEVDLMAPRPSTATLFSTVASVRGLAWNASGATLFAVSQTNGTGTGTVVQLNITGNAILANPIGQFGAGPDGVAVGLGNVAGCVYVNDNGGTVWEIALAGSTPCSLNVPAGVQINPIAKGNSRGDLIAADPAFPTGGVNLPDGGQSPGTFPSLLITQRDGIYRLGSTIGGGFFGAPTSTVQPVVSP